MTLATYLTIGGALAELIGVALIVNEIRNARASARAVLADRPLDAAVKLPDPPRPQRGILGRMLGIDLDEIAQVTNKQLRHALNDAADRLIEAERERDRALRVFLSNQLGAGITARIIGVCFFVAGILATAAAQLLQIE